MSDPSTDDEEAFEALASFVEEEMGFATSHYNDSYLQRRFASRMRRTGSADYEAYLDRLSTSEDEQQALLDALSINVTGFFRNPDVWEGIRDVLREYSGERDPIRVWSAACADGREPYSLSMLAHDDPEIDEDAVEVVATDINDEALDRAREGVYRSTRTVDVADQLEFLEDYESYVERDGDRFAVRDRIRAPVAFEHHDLINDDGKSGFDLVICRNLFIYIDNEYKWPVLETIADAMDPGGHLVIGKAETIPPDLQTEFSVVDGRLRIYERT